MKKILALVALISLLSIPVFADDCVEVDLEVDPVLVPGQVYYFYAELTNCSDEAGIVYLTISMNYILGTFEIKDIPVYMGAGETFSRSMPFVLPHMAPAGDGSMCVTARKGEVTASDCVYFTIENGSQGRSQKPTDQPRKGGKVESSAVR